MELKTMNISSNKVNNANSPKTPGGISKSLLTPCRRVGLSRKWKKGGVSPFISPLGSSNANKEETKLENVIRKRKKSETEVEGNSIEETGLEICTTPKVEIGRTPVRTLLPRKKSKTLVLAQECEEIKNVPKSVSEVNDKTVKNNIKQGKCELNENAIKVSECANLISDCVNKEVEPIKVTKVSNLSRKSSKSSIKLTMSEPPTDNTIQSSINKLETVTLGGNKISETEKQDILFNELTEKQPVKVKSPNNLKKECMVVIQKKILETDKIIYNKTKNKLASQTLFDSDSDDVPLSDLNLLKGKITPTQKPEEYNCIIKNETAVNNVVNQNSQNKVKLTNKDCVALIDNDFVETKEAKVKKLEKTTSITGLKNNEKLKANKVQTKYTSKPPQSINLCEEDDDFDYSRTRTIFIKKTYDKVPKLSKAKSTGSITQKDIDDLTLRIERKKDLLLAKSLTSDTKELRDLIKKWQIGCQTALMELLELMKKKMPEQNMEHSELLQMLKIPPDLVGYDSDTDSFNTPDDAAIILSALKIN